MVLFRANGVDTDSRAKKFGMTLARLGYDVHLLSAEPVGSAAGSAAVAGTTPRHLTTHGRGGELQVTVHTVPIGTTHRDLHRAALVHRRRRRFTLLDRSSEDEYRTAMRELRAELATATGARKVLGGVRLAWRGGRGKVQWAINVAHRLAWRRWDDLRANSTWLATTRGVLPEIEDYAAAFAPVLDRLEPDVIHAHHPLVLGTAVRAARRRRAAGATCHVIYDAREDFAGLPVQEQGRRRRHAVLVREEARYIRDADAVITVSEPIATTLAARYALTATPTVVLNVPVDDVTRRPGGGAVWGLPTVRDVIEVAGRPLPPEVPLLVYSGAVSKARGVDVLIEALPHLPEVHAVVVPVPYPHPQLPALQQRAAELGVGERFHVAPPVGQDHLLHYLAGADLAVFPIRTGSANIEQALPNKLFESVHAGLPIVTCDAALIAAFVREHDLGEVFSFGRAGEIAGQAATDAEPAARDLARAVRRALDNPRNSFDPHWQELRRHYSWQGQERAIRGVYTPLVAPPTPDGIEVEPFGSLTVDGRSS